MKLQQEIYAEGNTSNCHAPALQGSLQIQSPHGINFFYSHSFGCKIITFMLGMIRSIFLRLSPLVVMFSLLACGGNSSMPPNPNPTPAAEHLYANSVDPSGTDRLLLFDLPLTSNSVPSFSATTAAVFNRMAVDANGNVATLDINCHLTIYNAPLSSPLVPSATLSSGANCQPGFDAGLAFNAAGDLFVTNGGSEINVFPHPVSAASTVSQVITSPGQGSTDLVFDASGNLYVSAVGIPPPPICGFISNTIYVFTPPYTAAPTGSGTACGDFAFGSITASKTQVFVSRDNGFVDILPIPIAGIINGVLLSTTTNVGATLAVDQSGNVYVNDGQIRVFASPVSSASTPIVTLNVKVGDIKFKQ